MATDPPFRITAEIVLPLSIFFGGILLGLIFEILLLKKLSKKKGKNYEFLSSMRYMIMLSFAVVSIYATIHLTTMDRTLFHFLRKTLHEIMLLLGTIIAARLLTSFMKMYMKGTEAIFGIPTIFINLAKLLIYLVGLTIILDSLGVSITPILTAMGVGGLAVALALQGTLANLFSGLHVIASGKIKQGDYIKLSTGEEGYVIDMTWRDTTVKMSSENVTIIPNSKLASASVTNYSLPDNEMVFTAQVGVGYESNLKKVEDVTTSVATDVMREVSGGIPDFKPYIRFQTFADSRINMSVTMRVRGFSDQDMIQHEFMKRLHERYRAEGITIPFPVRTLFIRDNIPIGNKVRQS
jgi:small-conductance mechanosensitive channel